MLENFFKTTLRYAGRNKGLSLINIIGLTLGLSSCILIGLFVYDEYQFDTFIPEADQVYRIYDVNTNHDGTQTLAVASPMYGLTMQQDFPEVIKTARVMMLPNSKKLFEAGNKKLYEESGLYVDSTFFDVFPLQVKYGTTYQSLANNSSIVISSELAQRFFGNKNPVGEQILMDKQAYQINAVVETNQKFHLQFNYLIPIAALHIPAERMQSWGWHQFYNYIKLNKSVNVTSLQSKFQKDVERKSALSRTNEGSSDKPYLQPLKNIHLYSAGFKFDIARRGNITYINALVIIAAFILLIACFNFVNLATAKSSQRAKEVGVRKSIGAGRKQLIFQFLSETVFFSLVSVVISYILSIALLPWLNRFTGKTIQFDLFLNPLFISSLIVVTIIVGIIAGFYPALVLSAFKPAKVLKGSLNNGSTPGKTPWLRHSLVISQFALSILLIISTIVVYNQVNYLHNKNLGFNKEQIMFFQMRSDNMFTHVAAFKSELLLAPGVTAVSVGYGFPGDAVAGDEIIVPANGKNISQTATQLMVDYDYIKTLGLQLVAGRDFSKQMKTDENNAWIINETAVRQLGFETPQKALGKDLAWHPWDAQNKDSLKSGKVIGVVKDFNYKSLYDKVETTVLQIYPQAAWKVAVKMKTSDMSSTISSVRKVWNHFSPEYPLEYKFLDENFTQMYESEDKLNSLLWISSAIAIFVGCLGLFGLAAFTAERRRKEIGVRKVLGASTKSVVLLLSQDFLKLVIVSLLIASPLAWYFMNKWLDDFAYRIDISIGILIIAAIISLSTAFITVSFHAIKTALANPVKSLRTE